MLAPSLNALEGSGWVSMNTPSTPAATAARATVAMSWTASRHPTRLVGLLKAVGQVHEGGRKGTHFGETPHVHHEVAVTMHGATLGEPHLFVARFADFVHRVLHRRRGHELPLLHVDNAPCLGCRDKQVRLAAQECGGFSTSATSAAMAASSGRWMSVTMPTPRSAFT